MYADAHTHSGSQSITKKEKEKINSLELSNGVCNSGEIWGKDISIYYYKVMKISNYTYMSQWQHPFW